MANATHVTDVAYGAKEVVGSYRDDGEGDVVGGSGMISGNVLPRYGAAPGLWLTSRVGAGGQLLRLLSDGVAW